MQKALRLGFIGGSSKSAIGLVHSIAARLDRRFELVAGCFSRDKDINSKTGYEWGVDENKIYPDFFEMLEK